MVMKTMSLFLLLSITLLAAEPAPKTWTVDGVKREGFVVMPEAAKSKSSPVVFVFHGHGGTAKNAIRSFDLHTHWPAAIVVYLQGLPTPGKLTDPEGKKTGWQHGPGDQSDRDLKFFDAVLKSLKDEARVDDSRIYSTGHSNGGGFTYLLWGQRGDVLAAVAPSAAVANTKKFGTFKPKPVLHIGGEQDTLVKWEWQKAGIDALKKLNGVAAEGKPWADSKFCTIYESKADTPVATYITQGDHAFAKDAVPVIVKFFQAHALK
jgi:polyhydroxybutyrate depolymerase